MIPFANLQVKEIRYAPHSFPAGLGPTDDGFCKPGGTFGEPGEGGINPAGGPPAKPVRYNGQRVASQTITSPGKG